MEKLLHDSFANYVIQTSLDFADEDQRIQVKYTLYFFKKSNSHFLYYSLLNVLNLYYLLFVQHLMVNVFIVKYLERTPYSIIKYVYYHLYFCICVT